MPNFELTCAGPYDFTFTCTGGDDTPFTADTTPGPTFGKLMVNNVLFSPSIDARNIARIRLGTAVATAIKYGSDATILAGVIPAGDGTNISAYAWEHINDPTRLHFKSTASQVMKGSIYL